MLTMWKDSVAYWQAEREGLIPDGHGVACDPHGVVYTGPPDELVAMMRECERQPALLKAEN